MRTRSAAGHRVVETVGPWSVARVAFWLTLCLWAVAGVGLVALYGVGAVAGGLGGLRGFLATLGLTGIWASPVAFVPLFSIAALGASVVTGAVSGLAALLYNALVPLVGGVVIRDRYVPPSG